MVGEHDMFDDSDGTRHEVCSFSNHPNYQLRAQFDYDFAVLRLKKPVKLGYRAIPACLPDQSFAEDFLVGRNLTVSGWGNLQSGGTRPDVLHSVNVPGISNLKCKRSYNDVSFLDVTDSMICAGHAKGGVDACQGDSGGNHIHLYVYRFMHCNPI